MGILKPKNSDHALQDTEAKYRAIVEAFDGLIYVCSQDYRIEFVNAHFIERTGYDPTGEPCYRALHERDSICPWCVNEEVFKGKTVRWELQSPKDNRWYYVVNTPIYMADGRMSKQAMILDITGRKRIEMLLEAYNDILEMVAAGQPLRDTLAAVAEVIEKMLPSTCCSVLLLDEGGKRLHHGFASNLPDDYVSAVDGLAVGPKAGSCGTAAYRGETVIVEDTFSDPLWEDYRSLVDKFSLRSCCSVPIRSSSGNVLGTFALYGYQPRRPAADEVKMLESAAHLLGIAIERKHAERLIRESEERYRSLFEQSKDAIYMTGLDGHFIDANQSTLQLFGYSKDELLNEVNVAETYVRPSDRQRFIEQISRMGSVRDFEVKLRKKDGREMDCLLTSSIKKSKDGETAGYQGIIRDVTEQKKAVRALRQSEAQYRAVVEDQTELIYRASPDGRITFVNEAYCRYFQKKREELHGESFMPFVFHEDRLQVQEHFRSLGRANPVVTLEHRVLVPSGEICWQQWTNRLILDDQGSPLEVQSVGRDTTQRRLMEDALQKSAEKIKLFAYSVSHDLKSPAVGLYGLTKLLHNQYRDILDERGRTYCDQILKVAEQIAALVQKINLYISAKEVPLEVEVIRIAEILRMIKDEFSAQLNIRQISWIEPEMLPEIRADRIALLRVFRNFVDNALKYGGEKLTEIQIGYEQTDRFHVMSVRDNGAGIKGQGSEELFNFFERYGAAKEIQGTGLGLAIVKEIAEQHGGRVWMETPPVKGTTFFISIARNL